MGICKKSLIFITGAPLVVNHRGLVHQTWFVISIPLVFAAVYWWYQPSAFSEALFAALFFIVDALSHLVLDFGFGRAFMYKRP